jgi:hypothetical protein
MTELEKFINSLPEKDRAKVLEDIANSSKPNPNEDREVSAKETVRGILDLQVASGEISESERDRILADFNS